MLSLATALVAVGTVTLHLIGDVRHRHYLNYWGIDAGLFPKTADWILINGYYGVVDRFVAILIAILGNLHWLAAAAVILGLYGFILQSPAGGTSGEAPQWLLRQPEWRRRLIRQMLLTALFVSAARRARHESIHPPFQPKECPMRYTKTQLMALAPAVQLPAMVAAIPVKLYRNPSCYCCDLYAKYLEENGFKVDLINTTDMTSIKQKYSVPEKLEGCHSAIVEGYVVEGPVPAQFVQQMLKEHCSFKRVALPGMPLGSAGMPGAKPKPLSVYTLDAGPSATVFGSF